MWKATKETQTSKRNVINDIKDITNTIKEKLGVSEYYEIPVPFIQDTQDIRYGNEKFFIKKYNLLNEMLNGKWMITMLQPCSEKQSYWISKKLNIPIEKAKTFNKAQASEFLNSEFSDFENETTIDIFNFYKSISK